jgi:hypothetical protein
MHRVGWSLRPLSPQGQNREKIRTESASLYDVLEVVHG